MPIRCPRHANGMPMLCQCAAMGVPTSRVAITGMNGPPTDNPRARPAGDVGDIVVTVAVGLGASVGTGMSVGDEGPPGEVGAAPLLVSRAIHQNESRYMSLSG